jgi:hypothetical protein
LHIYYHILLKLLRLLVVKVILITNKLHNDVTVLKCKKVYDYDLNDCYHKS